MWAYRWNQELQELAQSIGGGLEDLLVPEGDTPLETVARQAAAGTPAEKIAWAAVRAVGESDPEDWVAFWVRAYAAVTLAPGDDLVDRLIFEGNAEGALERALAVRGRK